MKTLYLTIGLAVLILITACSKTKLKNEYAPLIGKWKWVYSIGGESGNTLLTPTSTGRNYTVEFCKRGNYKICASNTLRNTNGRVKIENNQITFMPNVTSSKKNSFFYNFQRFHIDTNDTLMLVDLGITEPFWKVFIKIK